jgi:uridine kinase
MKRQTIVIGIAGGSASGKSSIASQLYEVFQGNHKVKIIKQDDYYKDQSHLSFEERTKTNYDHPMAFDTELLVHHLQQLKKGETIEKPIYDFTLHTRSEKSETIDSRDVILLEGILVLAEKKIRDLCDIMVYVDTDSDIRLIRRLKRDIEERGRSLDSVCQQYLTTVKIMHEQFVEPSKKYAHIIIPEGGYNTVAIDLLMTKIKSIVE